MQGDNDKQLEEILKESYLTYAMSVIVSRALPDVKDGLKPVHRRILYSMYELNNTHDKPYKKSARVVGEVLGKYHPHGDAAIYDSLVRMAQYFSLRYLLVDGQGNFGSIDGDSPAAMRYTEVRMTKLAEEMLSDLEMETVEFRNNFDNTLKEPIVLPSKIPQLLINGSSGIAVGMATNIPPHNLSEIIDALIALIDKSGNIYEIVKGPDFPTGGIILGKGGIVSAYRTGKGIIKIRSKTEIKDDKILITEIPYQVSKTRIIEEIVLAVKDNKIEDIADLHDRSDKSGLLIELKLKKNASPEIVLNKLFEFTSLEVSYGIINLALVNNVPKVMNLEEMLSEFLKFRFEVIRKRIIFLRKKAEERRHIIIGLLKAIAKLDETVSTIRKSKDTESAIISLKTLLEIDEIQAKAILDMKLQKLISVEREKLNKEKEELDSNISYYDSVLLDDSKVYNIIKEELLEIKSKYGDKRKTEIMESYDDRDLEDLIPDEDCFVAYSEEGYIKRVSEEELKVQGRGGKGIQLQGSDKILSAKTHDTLLIFTNKGRVYGAKIYEIPDASRYAKGRSIQALVKLSPDEKVFSLLPLRDFSEGALVFATKQGVIKRTKADLYSNIRKTGINAIVLKDKDELVGVYLTSGNDKIVLASESGHSIMFDESQIRESGRVSQGVRGMKLRPNSKVVSFSILKDNMALFLTSKGFGKLTNIEEFKVQKRGGKGVICIKTNEKTGKLSSVLSVQKEDELVISTKKGKSVRVKISDISEQGRYAKGVRIIRLEDNDLIASCAIV